MAINIDEKISDFSFLATILRIDATLVEGLLGYSVSSRTHGMGLQTACGATTMTQPLVGYFISGIENPFWEYREQAQPSTRAPSRPDHR
jgi:hypothetical protein